ncbi:MAG: hypothetical protein GY829_00865, partial [Gammaproteobacteria bacterium]|nr:hypothetical protein [Gammaproteobacteria bacterium]
HLATPRKATNEAGQVVWQWESEAFGNALPQSSGIAVNLRFPGQYYDEETGLYYNYFRYYDPSLGRYLQSDPIGLRGGLNTYAYVGGNPIMYIDPFGLDKTITFTQDGSGTYNSTVVVTDTSTGQTVWTGNGSSTPNNSSNHNTINTGTYNGTVTNMTSPDNRDGSVRQGVFMGNVSSTKNGQNTTATGVFTHCGYTSTNKGSLACPTIEPVNNKCDGFWSNFSQGEAVTVEVNR